MKIALLLVAVAIVTLPGASFPGQTPDSHYKIVDTIHVEGDGGWDYVTADDSTGRLFVSHGTVVDVVDTKTGKTVGVISGTTGVHGIALAHDLNKGFTSNGKDSSVTEFDVPTLKVLRKIPVTGLNPDAILYDGFSHSILTFNGKTSNATVIDANTDKVTSTIALDGKPEFPATDNRGFIYDNIEDKNLVDVINAKIMKVEKNFSVAPGEGPSGLAIDAAENHLFIGCGNKLMVIADAKTGKVITSLPIGDHVDAVAWDGELKRAYASCGDGTLTVVQEGSDGSFKILETVATKKGARTMALDKKTHHIYLPTADFAPAPAPTAENPKPRPQMKPGTFVILDMKTVK